jgi:co-chaperonin GroES (HSP10)
MLVPVNDCMLVKEIQIEQKVGKIVIPQVTADDPRNTLLGSKPPKYGEVVKLPKEGAWWDKETGKVRPFCCGVGDQIVFVAFGATEVNWQGDVFWLVPNEGVVAVVDVV